MVKRLIAVFLICLSICVTADACTIFCFKHQGKVYFCNNEDWSDPFTEISFHPATDGNYAWVYFGFANRWTQGGVNEHGLCFDWVAGGGPFGWKRDPSKKEFEGNITEEMLRKCKNVDDAIEFFRRYNSRHLDYSVVMIADKDGNSVLVQWRDGKLKTEKNTNRLHSCGAGKSEVDARLSTLKGDPGVFGLADALRAGASRGRNSTKYSAIFALSEGKIFLFQNREFGQYLEIDYLEKLRSAGSRHRIASLFQEKNKQAGISKKNVKRTDDYKEAKRAIDLYLDGGTNNDFAMLSRAFREDATIEQADSKNKPANAIDFFRQRMRPGPKKKRTTRIVNLDLSGDTAKAKLEIDYPTFSIIDDMILKKKGNQWKIVRKVYKRVKQDNRHSMALAISSLKGMSDEGAITAFYKAEKESPRFYLIEQQMNQVGYDLLGKGKFGSAIDVFKINVDAFPNSANAYDSLAEGYSKNGNRKLAIKNYEKSLELNPNNPKARTNLKQLKERMSAKEKTFMNGGEK